MTNSSFLLSHKTFFLQKKIFFLSFVIFFIYLSDNRKNKSFYRLFKIDKNKNCLIKDKI